MQWIGIAWLNYLPGRFSAPHPDHRSGYTPKTPEPDRAASLQLINPKSWMMALAVVSVFTGNGAERQSQVVYLSLAFFLISIPCLGTWALLGAGSARVLRSSSAMQRFNRGMALLLLAAAWLSVLA